jgi:hypothetical protein
MKLTAHVMVVSSSQSEDNKRTRDLLDHLRSNGYDKRPYWLSSFRDDGFLIVNLYYRGDEPPTRDSLSWELVNTNGMRQELRQTPLWELNYHLYNPRSQGYYQRVMKVLGPRTDNPKHEPKWPY